VAAVAHGNGGPKLSGAALDAVHHRGTHLQIIASAGSGKTEVVSQRVAELLAEGNPPESIVAFTFTDRAAQELNNRIARRVEERSGTRAIDRLARLYVGTIHGFCYRLLRDHVQRYQTYDVLDENQLTAFLSREASRLKLRQLDSRQRLFASIAAFIKNVEVVENELLDPEKMRDPFRSVLLAYYGTLERYHLLTYGQQVVQAVKQLEDPLLAAKLHAKLRHLIVDEYQDVNPAQERLIELLTGPQVELCVVGDDDQAIYQWRGSDVSNIVTFADRYPNVKTFEITTNRRSRPMVIDVANQFACSIAERMEKTMGSDRPPSAGSGPEVVLWKAASESEEGGWIAKCILDLVDQGVAYRDIAVLVRTSAAYRCLMDQFATLRIPVQPAGRTGIFDQPEGLVLGHTMVWLTDLNWRVTYGQGQPVTDATLFDEYQRVFALSDAARNHLSRRLLK
jgi:DNA helicase-2/ATP-dependent DNA helicase PcrA